MDKKLANTINRRDFAGLLLGLPMAAALVGGEAMAATPAGFNIAHYRGKVVYLDFWASWCGPCKQSFPFMKSLKSRHPAADLAVVTVNLDRKRAQADTFLAKAGGGLPVIFDTNGAIAKQYKVTDMPTSLLFDRGGNLRFTHKGFHPKEQASYLAHIDQLVKSK